MTFELALRIAFFCTLVFAILLYGDEHLENVRGDTWYYLLMASGVSSVVSCLIVLVYLLPALVTLAM